MSRSFMSPGFVLMLVACTIVARQKAAATKVHYRGHILAIPEDVRYSSNAKIQKKIITFDSGEDMSDLGTCSVQCFQLQKRHIAAFTVRKNNNNNMS